MDNQVDNLGIAIIGMAGRFPGAKNIDEFWQNLCNGVESLSFFTDEELRTSGVDPEEFNAPNYVKAAPVLDGIELFDAAFFGYTPMEATVMDPQQRILLECAWEALEHAGYDPDRQSEPIGVCAGARMNTYMFNIYANPAFLRSQDSMQVALGNDVSSLSTRISYKLNLKGPSYMVQTACSTGLVAVHLACQSLLLGECRMALAGAVAINVPHRVGYLYQPGGVLSPDGHCRSFDSKAQGTIFGSGVGVVVLKRLEDALADGDCIYAVVRGSATNNDGFLKASFTAPSVEGQTDVILDALACTGTDADSLSYIEAHGSGTALGDSIEILALTNAFRASTQKKGFCRIGSVKTNVGHLDAAAGMAGLVKTVLSLKHKLIPPSLHFEQPNPQIDFANSPFYVNTRLADWQTDRLPRRAGVSAFGFGGANAHVILEEAPPTESPGESSPWQLLVFSARTSSALKTVTANLATHLKQRPDLDLADVAFTLQVGRTSFSHRGMVVCRTIEEAVNVLETADPRCLFSDLQESGERPVVFMFPGQGAQYVDMARELYQAEPLFRQEVDRCSELFKSYLGLDLRQELYPDPSRVEEAARRLEQTAITQPALFVIEYALARLWMNWGICPQAMIGHSIGEYVAACLADVFSLEDALALVAARGQLMQQLPEGAMLSVSLSEQQVLPFLGRHLALAASNGPASCVVSGPADAIAALQDRFAEQDVACRRLHTGHAFHSGMMTPILEPFAEQVGKVKLKSPQIPYISNVTGDWITPAEATDPSYWARHLRQTVRFAQGMSVLLQESKRILLEAGPGQTLSTFARQQLEQSPDVMALSSIHHPQQQQSDVAFLLNTLGRLWLAGSQVNWDGFHARERRHRVPLPTYPFERLRYWVDPPKQTGVLPALGQTRKKQEITDWFYTPVWKQSVLRASPAAEALAQRACWLVFSDECGLGARLARRLEQKGQQVVMVTPGQQLAWPDERSCIIDPRRRDDYDALLKSLETSGRTPRTIVHLWSVFPDEPDPTGTSLFDKCQDLCFYSLLFLAQALGEQRAKDAIQVAIVSNGLHQVESGDVACPEKAIVLGPSRVIPHEYPHITCRSIDVALPAPGTQREEKLIDQLVTELAEQSPDMLIAYRGSQRWIPTFDAVRLDGAAKGIDRLRKGGRYLITGGMGGIGLVLAEYLARTQQAKMILVGRSAFPDPGEWERWLSTHDDQDKVSAKIRKLQSLEAAGAQIIVASADVADLEQMQAVTSLAYERWGGIDGVIHAAGVAGGGMIQLKTPDMAAGVLAPKVKGALVLEALFKKADLDFLVFFSSISSIVGEFGQVDYCAANAFLNAFARRISSEKNPFVVAIDWDMWQGVGMAVSVQVPPALKAWRDEQLKLAILPHEGIEAFRRILSTEAIPQVIVSTTDLEAAIQQVNAFTSSHILEEVEESAISILMQPRPKLQTLYVAPRNEMEQTLADIWQRLLGIERVGIHDDFFELGGHSLLVTQLLNKLHKIYPVEISMRSLFENPTIAGVASLIERESRQMAGGEKQPIKELLHGATTAEKQRLLEDYLKNKIAQALSIQASQIPPDGSLAAFDLESITGDLQWNLQRDLQLQVYPHEIPRLRSIRDMATFVAAQLDRLDHLQRIETTEAVSLYEQYETQAVQEFNVQRARPKPARKNPPVIFVHASPRSGSTLFRVMLAGHPALYAPPELGILWYASMREWNKSLTDSEYGHGFFWASQGLQWTFTDLLGLDANATKSFLDELVGQDMPIQAVYARLQQLASPRLLVDKSPSYGMSLGTLEHAEEIFDGARYLYLVRHPYSMIESFVRIRLDKLFGPSIYGTEEVDPFIVAEKVWNTCNRNIMTFLKQVDPARQHRVRYEDLVRAPEQVMRSMCAFLEIPFDEAVIKPYDDRRERMIAGIGDPNILRHDKIDSELGEAWRKTRLPRLLSETTRQIAAELGYELPNEQARPASAGTDSWLARGETDKVARLVESVEQLSPEEVRALLEKLA